MIRNPTGFIIFSLIVVSLMTLPAIARFVFSIYTCWHWVIADLHLLLWPLWNSVPYCLFFPWFLVRCILCFSVMCVSFSIACQSVACTPFCGRSRFSSMWMGKSVYTIAVSIESTENNHGFAFLSFSLFKGVI